MKKRIDKIVLPVTGLFIVLKLLGIVMWTWWVIAIPLGLGWVWNMVALKVNKEW